MTIAQVWGQPKFGGVVEQVLVEFLQNAKREMETLRVHMGGLLGERTEL